MTGARAVAACALWVALGCNGALRFDESSTDAAAEAPVDVPSGDAGIDQGADLPSDAVCGCELHCLVGTACPGGTCGKGCVAECKENSSCTIATGDGARVTCEQGASCTFELGAGAIAVCSDGSNCRVQCDSRCAINCQTGATCQLRCAGVAAGTAVTGTETCP